MFYRVAVVEYDPFWNRTEVHKAVGEFATEKAALIAGMNATLLATCNYDNYYFKTTRERFEMLCTMLQALHDDPSAYDAWYATYKGDITKLTGQDETPKGYYPRIEVVVPREDIEDLDEAVSRIKHRVIFLEREAKEHEEWLKKREDAERLRAEKKKQKRS